MAVFLCFHCSGPHYVAIKKYNQKDYVVTWKNALV